MAKSSGGSQDGERGIIGAKPYSPADVNDVGNGDYTTEDDSQSMVDAAAKAAKSDGDG